MLTINFWAHLLDRTGFPFSRINFGQGWDSTLLFFSVTGEALSAFAYLLFIAVFVLFAIRWKQKRINREIAERHVPRVSAAYVVSTSFSAIVHLVNIYCYWVPLYRLAGVCLFLSGIALFVASLKTLWAFIRSLSDEKDSV